MPIQFLTMLTEERSSMEDRNKISEYEKNFIQEQWEKWEPAPGLAQRYDMLVCCDDYRIGFKVVLCNPKNQHEQVHLLWKNSVECYTSSNETQVYVKFSELVRRHEKHLFRDWTFFKVNNSEYLRRLSISSGTLSDIYNLEHYAIATEETILDIIGGGNPHVEFVNVLVSSANDQLQ